MRNKSKVYWVWLSLALRPGSRIAVNLLRCFDDAESVYKASAKDILETGVLKEKDRAYRELLSRDLDEAKDIVSWCGKNGVSVITPGDDNYPSNLYSLRDAPIVLYSVGDLPDFKRECCIAAVGARDMTDYGRVNSFRFGYGLAKGGAVIVSGLALGVDGMSMASACAAGGISVGVLGSGIDIVYPKEHISLFKNVIKNGAVITEYAPGSKPQRGAFPLRNRIISGLSQGTLVIEASRDSGSLITARHAIYQGKDLFSVPGSVGREMSEGTNSLIKEGAYAVTHPVDILERYEYVYPHKLDTSSAKTAVDDIDFLKSSERTAIKYGVATSEDRRNIYSKRTSRANIFGSPVVKAGDVAEEDSDIFEIPEGFGSKPDIISADEAKKRVSCDKDFKGQPREPRRVDFELLNETDMRVYNSMTPDTPMIPEELVSDDLPISDVMSSLTMLEISGAVEAGAGGYFMRCGADELSLSDSDK